MISTIDIPFELNIEALQKELKLKPGTEDSKSFDELAGLAQEISKPKFLYKSSFIDEKNTESITLEGVTFTSPAMRLNLDSIGRVFPYIATCGTEVEEIGSASDDILRNYWLNAIKLNLLEISIDVLMAQIDSRYKFSKLSSMNPGSGDATVWPIEQQVELFSIFGDVEAQIGVRLNSSFMMVPEMSVSGIFFPTETSFQNCQLCQREICDHRRAAFDQQLWDSVNRVNRNDG
ncbi:MAG: hypothetical protein MUO67_16900 [Anaerolineales bacterium]|nr:hypothetical protein [Anaerolineales bacterium]